MAYILTNGNYYITVTDTGKTTKTNNIDEAKLFATIGKAQEKIKKAPAKTKNYYIEDIDTNVKIQCNADGKIKRKRYSDNVKKLLYMTADGKCALCGRKLLFEDITIDHKIPLTCGGADSVENLQICCLEDNQFKGSIMPDDFMERITRIFLYQMDKKEGKRLLWKIVHKILNKMI